jgi:hypothetical protein
MNASLPTLPKIEGPNIDLVLDVYTHRSLRPHDQELKEEYGDTDRLAELGAKILELAVTFHYYSKRPMLSASEVAVSSYQGHRFQNSTLPAIQARSSAALSDHNIAFWLKNYDLWGKLRYAPSERDNVNTPQARNSYFMC